MDDLIKQLTAQRDSINAAKPTSPHIPIAVALANALIDRLQKHVDDTKSVAATTAPAAPAQKTED